MDNTALYKTILALAEKATLNMKQILSGSLVPPINQSGIMSKTDLKVSKNDTSIVVEPQFPDYAVYVDKGRGPGKMPPDKPIRNWVAAHNIPETAVFPIRRKIAKRGTTGKNFTEPLRKMIQLISAACSNVSKKTIKEELSEELNANLKSIEVKA